MLGKYVKMHKHVKIYLFIDTSIINRKMCLFVIVHPAHLSTHVSSLDGLTALHNLRNLM